VNDSVYHASSVVGDRDEPVSIGYVKTEKVFDIRHQIWYPKGVGV